MLVIGGNSAWARWNVSEEIKGLLQVRQLVDQTGTPTIDSAATLHVRAGLSGEEIDQLRSWATTAVGRLVEHGDPTLDGWGVHLHQGALLLQLFGRLVTLPDLDPDPDEWIPPQVLAACRVRL